MEWTPIYLLIIIIIAAILLLAIVKPMFQQGFQFARTVGALLNPNFPLFQAFYGL